MSDHNDARVPEGMGKSDAERREFGRQVAMDSILAAAHQGVADASHSEDEVVIPQLASHQRGQQWSRVAAVAAAVLIGTGAWLWLGAKGMLPVSEQMQVEPRDTAMAEPTGDETLAVHTSDSSQASTEERQLWEVAETLDTSVETSQKQALYARRDQSSTATTSPQGTPGAYYKGMSPEVLRIKTDAEKQRKVQTGVTTSPEPKGKKPVNIARRFSAVSEEPHPPYTKRPTGEAKKKTKQDVAGVVRQMQELMAGHGPRPKSPSTTGADTQKALRDQLAAKSEAYALHVATVTRTDKSGTPRVNPPGLLTTPPSSGSFFNDGADGDLRLRVGGTAVGGSGGGGGGHVKLNSESYDSYIDNAFAKAKDDQLSTFSIDVDTASYSNIRDLLKRGQLPTPDAVRIEELINYFDYKYAGPEGEHPLAIHVDMARAPWAPDHHLVRIGLQARKPHGKRPQANLVFLVDVSGSMSPDNKLPLLKRSMKRLVAALNPNDRIAIVVYAGAAGMALDSTEVSESDAILAALEKLKSGGSTNGGAGIELAYKIAQKHFVDGGVNRVILASDGDFNVGVSDRSSLIKMIEKKRDTGIFLSVLGFGRGNLKDSQMEQIANKGNGTYHYIDSLREGHRVLVRKLDSSLVTVAKDVKIQVEFNPAIVRSYRLIGYANRMLKKEDFNNDTKDAGEVGSGHTVTALYEVVTVDAPKTVDTLRYGEKKAAEQPTQISDFADEMMFVKVRYKQPDGDKSILLDTPFTYSPTAFAAASDDFRFAAAVASLGMVLRDSSYKGTSTPASILEIAEGAMGDDEDGYRNEFLQLLTPLQQKR